LEIEKGVKVIPAQEDKRGYEHGDIYLYNLREMSDESIKRYGLCKYKERIFGGKER